jgi:hypothetical protein
MLRLAIAFSSKLLICLIALFWCDFWLEVICTRVWCFVAYRYNMRDSISHILREFSIGILPTDGFGRQDQEQLTRLDSDQERFGMRSRYVRKGIIGCFLQNIRESYWWVAPDRSRLQIFDRTSVSRFPLKPGFHRILSRVIRMQVLLLNVVAYAYSWQVKYWMCRFNCSVGQFFLIVFSLVHVHSLICSHSLPLP